MKPTGEKMDSTPQDMDELARKATEAAASAKTSPAAVAPALDLAVTALGTALAELVAAEELTDESVLGISRTTGDLVMWTARFLRLLDKRAQQLPSGPARLHALAALHALNTTLSEDAATVAMWLANGES